MEPKTTTLRKKKRTVSKSLLDDALPSEPKTVASSLLLEPSGIKKEDAVPKKKEGLAELAALQEANPEAFAAFMEAAMAAPEEQEVQSLWDAAAKKGSSELAEKKELVLPGEKSLQADGKVKEFQASVKVYPSPGFTIKTSTKKGEKVFINACSHELVPSPAVAKKLNDQGEEVEGLNVPVSIGAKRQEEDNRGEECCVIDAIFNSKIVEDAKTDQRARDFLCQMAIAHVENKFFKGPDETLDRETFKLPKLKYKGDCAQHPQFVRDDSKKPKIAEVDSLKVQPLQEIPLGPPPTFEIHSYENKEDWPMITDKAPKDDLVVDCLVPKVGGPLRNPWRLGKVATNGYALTARVSGREQGKQMLPFCVLSTDANIAFIDDDRKHWILRVTLVIDTNFTAGPDPGSAQWRLQRALSDGKTGENKSFIEENKSAAERYGLVDKNAPSLRSVQLPPKGATAVDIAYAASHAATVAAKVAKDKTNNNDILPEDKFHQDDLVSQHYIKQREDSAEEKQKEAEAPPPPKEEDDDIDYVDVDDYRPGGKYGPPLLVQEVSEPPPTTSAAPPPPEALLQKGPALASKVWAELL